MLMRDHTICQDNFAFPFHLSLMNFRVMAVAHRQEKRKEEAKSINLSLMALGEFFASLKDKYKYKGKAYYRPLAQTILEKDRMYLHCIFLKNSCSLCSMFSTELMIIII